MVASQIDPSAELASRAVLTVEDLTVCMETSRGWIRPCHQLDLIVGPGEVVALMGPSGCGKTTLFRCLLGILDDTPGIVSGRIRVLGQDITPPTEIIRKASGIIRKDAARELEFQRRALKGMLGRDVTLIPPNAKQTLLPGVAVGQQIDTVLKVHRPELSERERVERGRALMSDFALVAGKTERKTPAQLSGGECQRIAAVMALVTRPRLILCDEPTSSVDPEIATAINAVLVDLARRDNVSVLMISHSVEEVVRTSDRVAFMFGGRIVETVPAASVRSIASDPAHPVRSFLMGDRSVWTDAQADAEFLSLRTDGCPFVYWCRQAIEQDQEFRERCASAHTPAVRLSADHTVRCWLFADADTETVQD